MLTTIARAVDMLALSLAIGTTIWFFFVQSPVLIRGMGRKQFVPLQMRLTIVLFRFLTIVGVVILVASLGHTRSWTTLPFVTATVALAATLLNTYLVVPRALRAGGKTRSEAHTPADDTSVARFASEGGGTASRFWHRAVVVLVVVMLGGLVPHAFHLVLQSA